MQQRFSVCAFFCRRQLILNRAAPTLVRSLESGQSRGVLQETSTIAVASMAKQFVGDLVEQGITSRYVTTRTACGSGARTSCGLLSEV